MNKFKTKRGRVFIKKVMRNVYKKCVVCHEITSNKEHGEFICRPCYCSFNKEFRINTRYVKKSTICKINHLIVLDAIEYEEAINKIQE